MRGHPDLCPQEHIRSRIQVQLARKLVIAGGQFLFLPAPASDPVASGLVILVTQLDWVSSPGYRGLTFGPVPAKTPQVAL